MSIARFWVTGLSVVGTLQLLCACAAGPEAGRVRTIAVIGRGELRVPPERFELYAGVDHGHPDVDTARAKVAEASARIIDVVQSFPIDEKRTHTTRFYLGPDYDGETGEFRGYDAGQSIVIHLLDLSKSQDLTLAVLRAGATSVSIDFLPAEDEEALTARARLEALRDARQKAEALAGVYGERVGPALMIGRPAEDWEFERGLFQVTQGMGGAEHTEFITWLSPAEIQVEAAIFVRFALLEPPPE